jgi:hypothetical protein
MIRTDAWQAQTLEELQACLEARPEVVALASYGSTADPGRMDQWSDLDCLLVVVETAFAQYYPSIEWLKAFGEVYGYQQSNNAFHGTTRLCFSDFRRLDLIITTPARFERLAEWPNNPFFQRARLLFSRSTMVSERLAQAWPQPQPMCPTPVVFDEVINNFWFKAMLASYSIVRNQGLVALYFALDLVRDGCYVAKLLLDRAEETSVHHSGGFGNELVARLASDAVDVSSAASLLNLIEHSAIQFDQLAGEWSEAAGGRRYPFLEWLETIRRDVHRPDWPR